MSRLFSLRRASHASPVAIALLVAANLVPLVGVLFLGWDLPTLVAIYWAENGVVGLFAVGRIATASAPAVLAGVPRRDLALAPPPPPSPIGVTPPVVSATGMRLVMVPFFIVHYGLFWTVHGVFVWLVLPMLFTVAAGGDGLAARGPDARVVLLATGAMLVSHGASFILNWILGGEYAGSTATAEMTAPYTRVVILHLTIIFGAFAVALLGAPIGALVVMVVLKTAVDLAAHLAERERAATRAGEAAPLA